MKMIMKLLVVLMLIVGSTFAQSKCSTEEMKILAKKANASESEITAAIKSPEFYCAKWKHDIISDKEKKEVAAEYTKKQREQRKKLAEKISPIILACHNIYHDTIDMKLKDLTVRETEQVQACQRLGFYKPL